MALRIFSFYHLPKLKMEPLFRAYVAIGIHLGLKFCSRYKKVNVSIKCSVHCKEKGMELGHHFIKEVQVIPAI